MVGVDLRKTSTILGLINGTGRKKERKEGYGRNVKRKRRGKETRRWKEVKKIRTGIKDNKGGRKPECTRNTRKKRKVGKSRDEKGWA